MKWPKKWVGTWTAEDGKSVTVSFHGRRPTVTVRPSTDAAPYESSELLHGGVKPISDLEAKPELDNEGRIRLSVEAGTPELGPQYQLYPAIASEDGGWKRPTGAEKVSLITLLPNTSIGLYDDYEEDLGVPWALPLEPLRWAEGDVQ